MAGCSTVSEEGEMLHGVSALRGEHGATDRRLSSGE